MPFSYDSVVFDSCIYFILNVLYVPNLNHYANSLNHMQHSWTVCHHHVWCNSEAYLQECPDMASGSLPVSLEIHPFLINVFCNQIMIFLCVVLNFSKIFLANQQGVREYPDCTLWEQGWREEPSSEGKAGYFPPEEEFTVLRDISKEQLQLWEAFSLPC